MSKILPFDKVELPTQEFKFPNTDLLSTLDGGAVTSYMQENK